MLMFLVLYLGRQQLVNNHSVRLESVPLFFALQAVITLWYYTSNTCKDKLSLKLCPYIHFFKINAQKGRWQREKNWVDAASASVALYKAVKWVISICWHLLIRKWWAVVDMKRKPEILHFLFFQSNPFFFSWEFAPVVYLLWNTTPELFMMPSLKHFYLHNTPGPRKMH